MVAAPGAALILGVSEDDLAVLGVVVGLELLDQSADQVPAVLHPE